MIFGFNASELDQQPLDLLLPDRMTDGHRHHVSSFSAGTLQRHMHERQPVIGKRRNGDEFLAMIGISAFPLAGERWTAATVRDLSGQVSERKELRETSEQLAVLQERARLAQIFHDITTQTLFSAKISAEVLPRVIERDPVKAIQLAHNMQLATTSAIAQMRVMLIELRPSELAQHPIELLLRMLAEANGSRLGIAIEVVAQVSSQPPLPVRQALYRIAQEALHNTATHSQATRVRLDLIADGVSATLTINDNGRGTEPAIADTSQRGLRQMREQATSIGADIVFESAPGAGTNVQVTWRK